jgi:prophage regulatory protein
MSVRLLTFPELKAQKGVFYTRVHLARMEKQGRFPSRVQCGPNRVAWIEHEVDEHLLNLPRGTLPLGPNGR